MTESLEALPLVLDRPPERSLLLPRLLQSRQPTGALGSSALLVCSAVVTSSFASDNLALRPVPVTANRVTIDEAVVD